MLGPPDAFLSSQRPVRVSRIMAKKPPASSASFRLEDVPDDSASWPTIANFAATFDGYSKWGSFERCAEIANARRHDTLDEVRTCLFFEQRRWRHFGEDPDEMAMTYIRNLVAMIRARVQNQSRAGRRQTT